MVLISTPKYVYVIMLFYGKISSMLMYQLLASTLCFLSMWLYWTFFFAYFTSQHACHLGIMCRYIYTNVFLVISSRTWV